MKTPSSGLQLVCTRIAPLVLATLTLALLLPSFVPPAASADAPVNSFPFMQPDAETLAEWLSAYDAAPRLDVSRTTSLEPSGYLDLLEHLTYVPSENSQGACGNCWAWAGTSALGIALDVEKDIQERLSVQLINSCEQETIGKTCCRGGWLSDFATFYERTGFCIPWDNDNAQWQDSDSSCDTPCGSIATQPQYDIVAIGPVTIPTRSSEGVIDRERAIRNIKTALDTHQAVWFAFFVPTASAWQQFTGFWLGQGESAVVNLGDICAGISPYAGHAVLCVGYDDTEPDNRYWLMLNSWGTAGGNRPNGLFRIDMDMDYNTTCGISAFYWQTLDVDFGAQPRMSVQPTSLQCSVLQFSTAETAFVIDNSGDGSLHYDALDIDPEGSGGEDVELAYDDGSAEGGHAGAAGSRAAVRFTPPQCPAHLEQVSVYFPETGTPWPGGELVEFAIEVYAGDGQDGSPDSLLGTVMAQAEGTGWSTVDLSSLNITTADDDIYVAVHFIYDSPAWYALGLDEATPSGRSHWRESGGQWLSLDEAPTGDGNWLMRTTFRTLESSWIGTSPATGSVAPGTAQEVAVTVDASALSAGEREASIHICSDDPTSNPTVLPVTVTVLPAADLVPAILSHEWNDVDSGVYSVTCAIVNEAFGMAGASLAELAIDGSVVQTESVPELGPGESHSFTYGPRSLSGGADTLSLTVDVDDDVYWEANEDNNQASVGVETPRPSSIDLSLSAGWNMVSVPLILDDASVAAVFPGAAAVYTWRPEMKSYVTPESIEPDTGYWVAVTGATNYHIEGLAFTGYIAALSPGWHLLGSVDGGAVDLSQPKDAPADSVQPFAYHWNPVTKGYDMVTTVDPGLGCWVAATQDCLLQMS